MNVKSKMCTHPGCTKKSNHRVARIRAVVGSCSENVKHGMVDVNSKRCAHPCCTTTPSRGMGGDIRMFCSPHPGRGMVHLGTFNISSVLGRRGGVGIEALASVPVPAERGGTAFLHLHRQRHPPAGVGWPAGEPARSPSTHLWLRPRSKQQYMKATLQLKVARLQK